VNNVLVERYAYDVFGRPTIRDANGAEISETAVGNPYLFTGRRYDAETALYYYRARYYDYYAGRFLQPDPLGYVDGFNLYAYVANNPLAWVDPFGLCRGRGGKGASVWEHIANLADILLALKEVSDIFEVKAGLGLGLEGKGQLGPVKGRFGGTLTSDALKVEQSRTTIVTGANAGANLQIGKNLSIGPSVSLEMDRLTGEVDASFTPIGLEHTSGVSGEPWKVSFGGTAVIFTGEVGINLTEVVDLFHKVTDVIAGHQEDGYTIITHARP
jgi:RHS repeat-associated protein